MNKYNYFGVIGLQTNVHRSFYINAEFDGCPGDSGIIVVIDGKDTCPYVQSQIYPQVMSAFNSLGDGGKWSSESIMGKSMDILATYKSSISLYA